MGVLGRTAAAVLLLLAVALPAVQAVSLERRADRAATLAAVDSTSVLSLEAVRVAEKQGTPVDELEGMLERLREQLSDEQTDATAEHATSSERCGRKVDELQKSLEESVRSLQELRVFQSTKQAALLADNNALPKLADAVKRLQAEMGDVMAASERAAVAFTAADARSATELAQLQTVMKELRSLRDELTDSGLERMALPHTGDRWWWPAADGDDGDDSDAGDGDDSDDGGADWLPGDGGADGDDADGDDADGDDADGVEAQERRDEASRAVQATAHEIAEQLAIASSNAADEEAQRAADEEASADSRIVSVETEEEEEDEALPGALTGDSGSAQSAAAFDLDGDDTLVSLLQLAAHADGQHVQPDTVDVGELLLMMFQQLRDTFLHTSRTRRSAAGEHQAEARAFAKQSALLKDEEAELRRQQQATAESAAALRLAIARLQESLDSASLARNNTAAQLVTARHSCEVTAAAYRNSTLARNLQLQAVEDMLQHVRSKLADAVDGGSAQLVDAVKDVTSHAWSTGKWQACTVACGGGVHTRAVTCRAPSGHIAPDSFCAGHERPQASKSCYEQACRWQPLAWSPCPTDCGGPAWQYRELQCSDGLGGTVAASMCAHDAKPDTKKACAAAACQPAARQLVARAGELALTADDDGKLTADADVHALCVPSPGMGDVNAGSALLATANWRAYKGGPEHGAAPVASWLPAAAAAAEAQAQADGGEAANGTAIAAARSLCVSLQSKMEADAVADIAGLHVDWLLLPRMPLAALQGGQLRVKVDAVPAVAGLAAGCAWRPFSDGSFDERPRLLLTAAPVADLPRPPRMAAFAAAMDDKRALICVQLWDKEAAASGVKAVTAEQMVAVSWLAFEDRQLQALPSGQVMLHDWKGDTRCREVPFDHFPPGARSAADLQLQLTAHVLREGATSYDDSPAPIVWAEELESDYFRVCIQPASAAQADLPSVRDVAVHWLVYARL